MKKIYFMFLMSLLLIGATVFADDVYIDSSGNVTAGVSASGNLEVTGASAEDAIVGVASGTGAAGVYGINTVNNNYGILGYDTYGVYGVANTGWAGYFQGDVRVTGNLTVDGIVTGYTETDPVFSAWDKSSGISIIESQITDLNHFTNVDETDPVFSAWDKSTGISITESQVTDIDKYSQSDVDIMLATLNARITALENQSATHWDIPRPAGAGTGYAYDPKISVNSSGNAVVVWQQYNGATYHIYANRYVAGMGWGIVEAIETGTGNAFEAQVSVDSSGNAIAVWRQHDGSAYHIYANRYVAGMGWGIAEAIETETGNAYSPQIGVDSSGNAIAVWELRNGTSSDIYANRYVANIGWGSVVGIETGTGSAYSPQISFDSNGNAIAVWEQYTGLISDIYANRYAVGPGWGSVVQIEAGPGDSYNPQISVDSNGNAIAVWQQYTGSIRDIYANRYVEGTGWGTAEVIETGTENAYNPQISVDSSGNAIAVWEQYSGSTDDIYANHYTAGTGWGTVIVIETGMGYAYNPQISVDSNGNAIAVWEQNSGSTDDIYANRYVEGTGWGTAEVIETGTGDAYFPEVGMDSSGNAIAVWRQHNGSTYDIYVNRFW